MDGEAAGLTRLFIWTALLLQLQEDRVEPGRQMRGIQFSKKHKHRYKDKRENGGQDEAKPHLE